MLTPEVLHINKRHSLVELDVKEEGGARERQDTNPADNIIVIGKMGFAMLAPKDLVCCEIYVVFKAHDELRCPMSTPPCYLRLRETTNQQPTALC